MGITINPTRSKFQTAIDIGQFIYYQDGVLGFYRGYVASMCTYVPNSAIWWALYHMYQGIFYILFLFFRLIKFSLVPNFFFEILFQFLEKLRIVLPEDISHLFVQCVAGTLGGFTTTLVTNPMDTIRARLQVKISSNSLLMNSTNMCGFLFRRSKEQIPYYALLDPCGTKKVCGCLPKVFQQD